MRVMRDDVSWLTIICLLLCALLFVPLSFCEIQKANTERQRYKADEERVRIMYLQERLDKMEKELKENQPQGKIKEHKTNISQKEIMENVTALLDVHKEEYLKENTISKKTMTKYMNNMYYFIEGKHIEGVKQVRLMPEYRQIEFVTETGCFIYLLDTE